MSMQPLKILHARCNLGGSCKYHADGFCNYRRSKNFHIPLLWPTAYTTACTTVQAMTYMHAWQYHTLNQLQCNTNLPRDSIRMQQMRKQLGDVAQFVGLQSMDHFVLLGKHSLEWSDILAIQHAEALQCNASPLFPRQRTTQTNVRTVFSHLLRTFLFVQYY